MLTIFYHFNIFNTEKYLNLSQKVKKSHLILGEKKSPIK